MADEGSRGGGLSNADFRRLLATPRPGADRKGMGRGDGGSKKERKPRPPKPKPKGDAEGAGEEDEDAYR